MTIVDRVTHDLSLGDNQSFNNHVFIIILSTVLIHCGSNPCASKRNIEYSIAVSIVPI